MDIIQSELLRAKKNEHISRALIGTVGAIFLFSHAIGYTGAELSVNTVFSLGIPLLLVLFGLWSPAISGYRAVQETLRVELE